MSSTNGTEELQYISIRRLLALVQDGQISIPRFQRPYVWNDEQRLELLRSIKEKMPIGSLLVWRTGKTRLACFDQLGPYLLPTKPISEGSVQSYLIDGHQRLTTLYGLFTDSGVTPQVHDAQERREWDIRYNLRDQDFVFVRRRGTNQQEPLVALHHLINSKSARDMQRELDKQAKLNGWADSDVDSWSEHLDEIVFRFTEYRVPVIPIVTDDLVLATKTFSRVNSQGTPMNEAHMVAAMTWTEKFDLGDRLSEIRKGLPPAWRDLDERFTLNIIKGLVDADITKAGVAQLIKGINDDNRINDNNRINDDKSLLDTAQAGLTNAIQFLHKERLVPHASLLPYGLQLVLLALALREAVPTGPDERARLAAWFQLTTLWESYSGAKSSTIGKAKEHLSALIQGGPLSPNLIQRGGISGLTRRFDVRSARSCGVLNALAARSGLMDARGQPIEAFELLAREGKEAIFKLVPSTGLDERARALQQSVANVFIMPAEQHKEFRKRLYDGPDLREDILRAHHLTPASVAALRGGRPDELLKTRLEELEGLERARYVEVHTLLLGARPEVTDEPEE
jgi:hypothetical protein